MLDKYFKPAPPPDPDAPETGVGKKLGWFLLLSLAGVTVTAGLAYFLRALLFIG